MQLTQFQFDTLVDGLTKTAPFHAYILRNGWTEEMINDAHDVFERYHNQIEQKSKFNFDLEGFERDIHEINVNINIGEMIVAIQSDYRWTTVCRAYYMKKHQWKGMNEAPKPPKSTLRSQDGRLVRFLHRD